MVNLSMCCPVDERSLCGFRSFLGLVARTDGFSCLSRVFSKILKENVADRCTLQTITKIQKFPGDYVIHPFCGTIRRKTVFTPAVVCNILYMAASFFDSLGRFFPIYSRMIAATAAKIGVAVDVPDLRTPSLRPKCGGQHGFTACPRRLKLSQRGFSVRCEVASVS